MSYLYPCFPKASTPTAMIALRITLATAIVLFTGLLSCRKSSPVFSRTILNADTVITDTTFFIDITLDNQRTLGIYNPSENPPEWGNIWGPIDPDSILFPYDRVGTVFVRATPNSLPQFSFSIGNADLYPGPQSPPRAPNLEVSVADSFFAPRNLSYSKFAGDTSFNEVGYNTIFARTLTRKLLTPGVNISWVDSTGTIWESLYGTADQTGSYFTITAFQLWDIDPSGFVGGVILTAGFVCTLYDGKGHSIRLTQGRFRQKMWL